MSSDNKDTPDYYFEDGLMVFKERHHIQRGFCCDSGCRHCPWRPKQPIRVVSMVPSWTETLIECGVEVVGRTRFCIHPKNKVRDIPVVGGTKSWNWNKVDGLAPDLIIFDKEENPKEMADQSKVPYFASHIVSINDMSQALFDISVKLKNKELLSLSQRWREILMGPPKKELKGLETNPALIRWGKKPSKEVQKVIYIIWKNPWIAVSANTFIGSMLEYTGFGVGVETYDQKYPEIHLEALDNKESTLLLFSSEPYPFLTKNEGLGDLGFPYAFVDGEPFSWFGIRSLRYLES